MTGGQLGGTSLCSGQGEVRESCLEEAGLTLDTEEWEELEGWKGGVNKGGLQRPCMLFLLHPTKSEYRRTGWHGSEGGKKGRERERERGRS